MSEYLNFTKLHGAGNDFVLIDGREHSVNNLTADYIRKLSDRHTGIGFDQLLIVTAPSSREFYAGFQIYNADGSAVSQCGNGLRCIGRYLKEHDINCPDRITIECRGKQRTLTYSEQGVAVNIGAPSFKPEDLPFAARGQSLWQTLNVAGSSLSVLPLALDNPHAALEVNKLNTLDIDSLGASIACHERFPEGTNVHFYQRLSKSHIATRTYERGVGETLACGTGACSAAIAVNKHYGDTPPFQVTQLGGVLGVDWTSLGSGLWLTGPTAIVFSGRLLLTEQAPRTMVNE